MLTIWKNILYHFFAFDVRVLISAQPFALMRTVVNMLTLLNAFDEWDIIEVKLRRKWMSTGLENRICLDRVTLWAE